MVDVVLQLYLNVEISISNIMQPDSLLFVYTALILSAAVTPRQAAVAKALSILYSLFRKTF
jgi:hypothetical protein